MMRIALWLVAFLVVGATTSDAQEIPVRSGAHDGFTRLVVHLPRRVEWQLNGTGRERRLSFGKDGMRFDLRSVFARIDGRRLAAVRQPPGRSELEISTSCDCTVEAVWAGTSMLVIDVRDAGLGESALKPPDTQPNTETSGVSEPDPDRQPDKGTAAAFGTDLIWTGQPGVPSASSIVSRGLNLYLDARPLRRQDADMPAQARADMDDTSVAEAEIGRQLNAFRTSLAEQIGRATSQGLLVVGDDPVLPASSEGPEPSSEKNGEPDEGDAATDVARATVQSRFETGFARGIIKDENEDVVLQNGRRCLAPEFVDVTSWAEGADFATELGTLRKQLVGEFDRVDPDVTRALTRAYIHFGFGAEALQVLQLVDTGAENRTAKELRILRDMAQVLETGALDRPSILHGQMACDGPVAAWSVLAHPDISPQTEVNDDAVLRTISAMPRHLRDYLGPMMARRFLAAGREDTADRVFQILGRDDRDGTQAEQMARAEAALLSDDLDAADQRLADVVAGNSLSAAEALLRRIETRIATGRGVSEDMADLASAYAVENREAPIGQALTRASIEAVAASGDFNRAFEDRNRQIARLSAKADAALSNTLFSLLSKNAADITFLAHGFAASDAVVAELRPETGNAVAARFLKLGFPEEAGRYVASETTGDMQAQRRRIRAEIALAQGQPRSAQIELMGLKGDDVAKLRAEALTMTGQYDMARDLFIEAGDPASAARQSAQVADWAMLEQTGEEDLAMLAGLLGQEMPAPDPNAPLAQGRALLEISSRSRETVRALLNNRPPPAPE